MTQIELQPGTTALIVVDMQHYFCRSDSPLGRFLSIWVPEHFADYTKRLNDLVIPNISKLLRKFRQFDALVIFTEFGSERTDGSDLPHRARQLNKQSTAATGNACFPPLTDPSSRAIPELKPTTQELVVPKATSGPLAGTSIAYTLHRHGIDTVVITGVATDVCVLGTARELSDSNFTAYLAEDAVGTPLGTDAHAAALSVLSPVFASITTTDEIGLSRQSHREVPLTIQSPPATSAEPLKGVSRKRCN